MMLDADTITALSVVLFSTGTLMLAYIEEHHYHPNLKKQFAEEFNCEYPIPDLEEVDQSDEGTRDKLLVQPTDRNLPVYEAATTVCTTETSLFTKDDDDDDDDDMSFATREMPHNRRFQKKFMEIFNKIKKQRQDKRERKMIARSFKVSPRRTLKRILSRERIFKSAPELQTVHYVDPNNSKRCIW